MGRTQARFLSGALVFGPFFVMAFGLGYPTLNRYEPARVNGVSDAGDYADLIVASPRAVEGKLCYRVLVPYVAKPFYWMARGWLKTWDPVYFGLLVANAFFTATTAFLLFMAGRRCGGNRAVALVASCLSLLNFNTANWWLAGLVDSGEGCALMLLTWALLSRRWWLLPIGGALGAFAKESFVPLAVVYVAVWWLSGERTGKGSWSTAVGRRDGNYRCWHVGWGSIAYRRTIAATLAIRDRR